VTNEVAMPVLFLRHETISGQCRQQAMASAHGQPSSIRDIRYTTAFRAM
jgi:hypothetical protein